jgi:hypothetical protein
MSYIIALLDGTYLKLKKAVIKLSDKFSLNSSVFLLLIPLLLSAFTHLWNPIGFPGLDYDEGVYMGRAFHILKGQGPQEQYAYDHPYFGQIFLAGVFKLIGYPYSLHPSVEAAVITHSIEMLWLVPRIVMGILAVFDTFLIYKIGEIRYNRKVGFISSFLFAVMPITWLTRWILLDSIQLPFLLSSILLAVCINNSKATFNNKDNPKNKIILLSLASGALLGLAIFTKIPAFIMIPLIGFLIYTNSNKSIKLVGLWFIPVILIPMIWPAYAISVDHFNDWLHAIYFQTHRESKPLFESLKSFFKIDPILLILGMSGLVFAAIKRDYFLLLWTIPFIVFLSVIGYVSTYHLIPLLPGMCIGPSRFIASLANIITYKKLGYVLLFTTISMIGIYALITTPISLTTSFNSSYFKTAAFITQKLSNSMDRLTVVTNPLYLWILRDVFYPSADYKMYETHDIETPAKTQKVVLLLDQDFMEAMSKNDEKGQQLQNIYKLYSNKPGIRPIEMGDQKNSIVVLLPNQLTSAFTQQEQKVDLLDRHHIWKTVNDARVRSNSNDGELNITVKTDNKEEVFNRAFLQTQINTTKKGFLELSLEYLSKSIAGRAIFYTEIIGYNGGNIIWHFDLGDTFGSVNRRTFILPQEMADKQIEIRLYIITNGPGEHILTVKKATIITN